MCEPTSQPWPARLLGLAVCTARLRAEKDTAAGADPHRDLTDAATLLLAERGRLESIAEWTSPRQPQILARFAFLRADGHTLHFRWTVDVGTNLADALETFPVRRVSEAEEIAAGRSRHHSRWKAYGPDVEAMRVYIANVLDEARAAPDAPDVAVYERVTRGPDPVRKVPPPDAYGPFALRVERRRRFAELRDLAAASGGLRIVRAAPEACWLCGGIGRRFVGLAVRIGTATLCPGCAAGVDVEAPKILRRAVRRAHRARWDERGGPAWKWPMTTISVYLGAGWFD